VIPRIIAIAENGSVWEVAIPRDPCGNAETKPAQVLSTLWPLQPKRAGH
jgi:hypothetical protein